MSIQDAAKYSKIEHIIKPSVCARRDYAKFGLCLRELPDKRMPISGPRGYNEVAVGIPSDNQAKIVIFLSTKEIMGREQLTVRLCFNERCF